jgi:hypothetical protein
MKYILQNKKGEELVSNKTVGLIIAVLCIVFLGFLFVQIYFHFSNSEKEKQAEGVLNGAEGIITAIKEGKLQFDKEITSPTDWYIFGFTGLMKPNSCLGEKCVCICQKANVIASIFKTHAQLEECTKTGVCSAVPNLKEDFEIKIEKGKITSISVLQINEQVSITEN